MNRVPTFRGNPPFALLPEQPQNRNPKLSNRQTDRIPQRRGQMHQRNRGRNRGGQMHQRNRGGHMHQRSPGGRMHQRNRVGQMHQRSRGGQMHQRNRSPRRRVYFKKDANRRDRVLMQASFKSCLLRARIDAKDASLCGARLRPSVPICVYFPSVPKLGRNSRGQVPSVPKLRRNSLHHPSRN